MPKTQNTERDFSSRLQSVPAFCGLLPSTKSRRQHRHRMRELLDILGLISPLVRITLILILARAPICEQLAL
jgi:hypothetical protein